MEPGLEISEEERHERREAHARRQAEIEGLPLRYEPMNAAERARAIAELSAELEGRGIEADRFKDLASRLCIGMNGEFLIGVEFPVVDRSAVNNRAVEAWVLDGQTRCLRIPVACRLLGDDLLNPERELGERRERARVEALKQEEAMVARREQQQREDIAQMRRIKNYDAWNCLPWGQRACLRAAVALPEEARGPLLALAEAFAYEKQNAASQPPGNWEP